MCSSKKDSCVVFNPLARQHCTKTGSATITTISFVDHVQESSMSIAQWVTHHVSLQQMTWALKLTKRKLPIGVVAPIVHHLKSAT